MIDQRRTWWIWNVTAQRLSKWALALLQGRRYTIRLAAEGTGHHDPLAHLIQVNPQLFPEQSVEVQFRLTQGLLAHECGHAWFTGNWPDQSDNILQELTNMLEDQRIEIGICSLYPGIAPAVRLLGDHVYASLRPSSREAKLQAHTCCLAWRWAHTRTDEAEMFERLRVSPTGQELWMKIRPLVEQAWTAEDTQAVIRQAKDILTMLDLPLSEPRLGLSSLNPQGIPHKGAKPIAAPSDPTEIALGLGGGARTDRLPSIPARLRTLDPVPYFELEEKMRSPAACLAEALKEPRPDQHLAAHEYRGRYSFRQELRTPETPHLANLETGKAARSLALYVLVDRSGSMSRYDQAVREALMMIFLAATRIGIPIGIAFFGEDDFDCRSSPERILVDQVVAEVAPLEKPDLEPAKAFIACYTGWASEEYLDWGLRKAETELGYRAERLHVLIVIHDGEPVYTSGSVSDWELSLAHLRRLEQRGIIPIGIHLGEGKLDKLQILFSHLVACPLGEKLEEKLGQMLCSLA